METWVSFGTETICSKIKYTSSAVLSPSGYTYIWATYLHSSTHSLLHLKGNNIFFHDEHFIIYKLNQVIQKLKLNFSGAIEAPITEHIEHSLHIEHLLSWIAAKPK